MNITKEWLDHLAKKLMRVIFYPTVVVNLLAALSIFVYFVNLHHNIPLHWFIGVLVGVLYFFASLSILRKTNKIVNNIGPT